MKLHVASACVALAASLAFADTAGAQTVRQRTPEPSPPPGIQKPDVSPSSQAMSALSLKIDALRQSAGRQVVVLHFETPQSGRATNNAQTNDQVAEFECKQALGDRFGRVLSRMPATHNGFWFLSRVVCETAP